MIDNMLGSERTLTINSPDLYEDDFVDRLEKTRKAAVHGTACVINEDIDKFKQEGGNIIIGTPGRIEDLLMGKTDSLNKNVFVQSVKTLVSK